MVDGVFMWSGQDIAVIKERAGKRDTEDKNKGDGPSLPSNHSFKYKSKER